MATLIIVDGLPAHYTTRELHELFEPYGDVVSAQVVRDALGRSLGFGYIEMSKAESCDGACAAMNGRKIGEHVLRVEVSKAH